MRSLLLLPPLLLLALGCTRDPAASPTAVGDEPAASPETSTPSVARQRLPERETWDLYTIGGVRVGYGRTRLNHQSHDDGPIVVIDALNALAVKRFNRETRQQIHFVSRETPDGRLIDFQGELDMGSVPTKISGRVEGDLLRIQTQTLGKTIASEIPWTARNGGLYAMEASLLRQPMQPGQRRSIRGLSPTFDRVAVVDIELEAKDYEPAELDRGSYSLLRIDSITRFGDGQALAGTLWCDRTGDILKTQTDAIGLQTCRTTEAAALKTDGPAEFDLGRRTMVMLQKPLEDAHHTRRARYRVHLDGSDPAAVFVAGPSQQVCPIDPHTAEITVIALRGDTSAEETPVAESRPRTADREPNNLIQSDAPKVVSMAQEAAGDLQGPWQVALALERFVHERITQKDFSQAFATAAEVAENPVGDCTEHAVLLAALCRARGIPARAALGLVYMQGQQAFGFHMWNEAHIGGRWVPLDATLGQGGIGAAHLKLAHSSLEGGSAYSSFLPVVQVAGRLKIEVLEAE